MVYKYFVTFSLKIMEASIFDKSQCVATSKLVYKKQKHEKLAKKSQFLLMKCPYYQNIALKEILKNDIKTIR